MNQRQSWKWDAEAAFKRIAAHEEGRSWCSNGDLDKKAMAAPYTPPPNVAAWLKARADKPKPHGRDIESLMRYHKAHERDIGYWEDAPRGPKFGGGGGKPTTASQKAAQTTPQGPAREPSAAPTTPPADGTWFEWKYDGRSFIFKEDAAGLVQYCAGGLVNRRGDIPDVAHLKSSHDGVRKCAPPIAWLEQNGHADVAAELRGKGATKPRDDVATGARAWAEDGFAWAQVGGTLYSRVPDGRFVESVSGHTGYLKPEWELRGTERDAIVAECRKAMGLDTSSAGKDT